MVSTIIVIDNGRNPNSIKAHTLDVVKIVFEAYVASATIVAQVAAVILGTIVSSKSISQYLVDCPSFPLLSVCTEATTDQEKYNKGPTDPFL